MSTALAMFKARKSVLSRIALNSPEAWVLLTFCVWAATSAIWAPNPVLALAKSVELALIGFCAITIAATALPGERGLRDDVAIALGASVAVLMVFNLVVHHTPLPLQLDSFEELGSFGSPLEVKRPRLVLAYAPPLLAGDLLSLLVIALAVSEMGLLAKVIGLLGSAWLLMLTDARTAFLAVPAAIGAALILGTFRVSALALVGLAASFIATVLAIVMMFLNNGSVTGGLDLGEDFYTVSGRMDLWQFSWPIILDQWMTGIGFYGSRYLLLPRWFWAGHTHNSFVEVALCLGLLGLVILCVFIGISVWKALKTSDRLLVSMLVYTGIIGNINPIIFDPTLPMFYLLLALSLSANTAAKRARAEQSFHAGRVDRPITLTS
ncbi:O-antigen ligase family protein [Singulisphaera rosea]